MAQDALSISSAMALQRIFRDAKQYQYHLLPPASWHSFGERWARDEYRARSTATV